jgi:type IV pilus assembly protein PilY1
MRLRSLALSLAAIAALSPSAPRAGEAACTLPSSSLADTLLNPSDGEDTEFFVTSGGVPNIALFLDTSESMLRVGPDGAGRTWGSFQVSGTGYGCENAYADAIEFQSSCGRTTWDGETYDATHQYRNAAVVPGASPEYCPSMDRAGRPMDTTRPGFDPDFPDLFARSAVYRDAVVYMPPGTSLAWVAPNAANGTPEVDGWNSNKRNAAASTEADFCSRYADETKKSTCNACLTTKGYFFDGDYLDAWQGRQCASTANCSERGLGTCVKDNGSAPWPENNSPAEKEFSHCRVPQVWFTGNRLDFQPPKFVVAKKAMKDVLAQVKLFRLGVYALDTSGGGASVITGLNPACNQFGGTSQFFNNRNSTRAQIDALTFTTRHAALAESLLDLGHLYATPSLSWFDATYDDATFEDSGGNQASTCFACQKSSVIMVTDGSPTGDGRIPDETFATDAMTEADAKLPTTYAGMAGKNITEIVCPDCETGSEVADPDIAVGNCYGQQLSGACNALGVPIPSYLPRVAWYLHNVDLRTNTETGADGYAHTGKQTLDVYTIGLGVRGKQRGILQNTADAGGGKYYDANGGSDLRRAIDKALEAVNSRSVAFGAASMSTLQASASQGVLVPRFTPSKSAVWDGHLFAFDLWSEFTGGCTVPTSGASNWNNKDYDCDGKCTSVFLREKGSYGTDADGNSVYLPGAFIQEDATGAFVRNDKPNRAPCGNGNKCSECGDPTKNPGVAAVPWWDAGDLLSPLKSDGTDKTSDEATANPDDDGFKPWSARKIYTAIDSTLDGKITSADATILLSDETARVTELLPYLNLQGNDAYCDGIADRLRAAGDTATADAIRPANLSLPNPANKYRTCGQVVIRYVMGADVFDERGCTGFPSSTCTRKNQLGDIFHSSPVEVWPPLPSDGLLCSRGLHPQCLPSLYSASIDGPPKTAGNANAYDDYAKSAAYRHRNKFALVGANDGMLHAILTGVWQDGKDDPRTAPKEDRAPYEGYHDEGTGEELWAFVPPDLLPKLHLLLGSDHQYFVDGTAMVRDVWIDGGLAGQGNGLTAAVAGSASKDRVRQGSEFFTVAVVGERRGGNHYFALDVTDAADSDGAPRFMWLYPQADDRAQLSMGETYADFAPTPPPIGPVRIDAGTPPCTGGAKAFTTGSGANTCFEERWTVFLSGGFDPQYTRGRGVHLIDLGSGDELFDFSQPEGAGGDCTEASDPRCHLNYPVAATVGMMMWGKQNKQLNSVSAEGYFDTATFGDTGGQLWVLRFSDPGKIDAATGKVDNWFGARVFQHGKTASTATTCGTDFCGSQPFFHITANLPLRANGLYRVLAGTGDRYNLLAPTGGVCSPTNLRACILKGCSVTFADGTAPGASFSVDSIGTDSYGMAHAATCSSFDASKWVHDASGPTSAACGAAEMKVRKLRISCPSTAVCNGSTTGELIEKDVAVVCANGLCELAPGTNRGTYVDLKNDTGKKNWFFSIRVFDETGDRQIFSTLADAIDYDKARLSEADLTDLNAYDAGTSGAQLAEASGTGWKYFFDHGFPNPTGNTVKLRVPDGDTFAEFDHYLYRSDERVGSSTAVEAGCTFFNTLQVALPKAAYSTATDCPVNSPCKAGKRQVSYLYGANPGTGGQCLYVDGTLRRSQQTETIVPPHIGKLVAYVASGQVSFGLTSVRIPQGGTNISLGEAQDVTSIVEVLPIDRDLHDCRHAPRNGTAPANCK